MNTDGAGLLSAFVLDGNGGGKALDWAGIRRWDPKEGVLWIHLDRVEEEARQWLLEESGIDAVAAETLLRAEGNRPRVIRIEDALVIALRGINRSQGGELDDMPTMHVWAEGSRIISLRRRRLEAGSLLASDIEQNRGPRNACELLIKLTEYLINPIIPVVAELSDVIDELQQEVLATNSAGLRHRLQDARQETINFRRHISPQRDALSRLHSESVSWLTHEGRSQLREIADYVARYVEDLDAARERAIVAQDELNNQLAERMNKTMYLLTIISALLLPASLLTGLFGINVGGMPGVDNNMAFALVAIGIPIMAVLEFWLLKRLKWI